MFFGGSVLSLKTDLMYDTCAAVRDALVISSVYVILKTKYYVKYYIGMSPTMSLKHRMYNELSQKTGFNLYQLRHCAL